MKFLLNVNIHRQLGKLLSAAKHASRHAGDVGLALAEDPKIVEEAKGQGETIITHDLDYGNLLAFSAATSPSVIIFRIRNIHPQNLYKRLEACWTEIEKPLSSGAIVIIEDAALRIRKLPIINSEE